MKKKKEGFLKKLYWRSKMEDKKPYPKNNSSIDPIGIELVLGILSTSISILSVTYQLGLFSRKNKKILKEFKNLRKQLLRLHNCLDDLILTVNRLHHYNPEGSLLNKKLTLSDTHFALKQQDYYRWLDINESLYNLNQETFEVITNIRNLCLDISEREVMDTLSNEILAPFDELLINFQSYEFGQFISKFRDALSHLDGIIVDLIYYREER